MMQDTIKKRVILDGDLDGDFLQLKGYKNKAYKLKSLTLKFKKLFYNLYFTLEF